MADNSISQLQWSQQWHYPVAFGKIIIDVDFLIISEMLYTFHHPIWEMY